MISTRVRGTRGEDLGTGGSTVGKFTQAGETCHTIHTGALVQTGAGAALVDVHLAEVTYQDRNKDVASSYRAFSEYGGPSGKRGDPCLGPEYGLIIRPRALTTKPFPNCH